jgi:RHS repeat-associated protein
VNDPETGLVYMQARYYDPVVGRFLSIDPTMSAAGNTFNFNRYDYANNNPIANVDPNGRQEVPVEPPPPVKEWMPRVTRLRVLNPVHSIDT